MNRLYHHHDDNGQDKELRHKQIQPATLLASQRAVTIKFHGDESCHGNREREEEPECKQGGPKRLGLKLVFMQEPIGAYVGHIFSKVKSFGSIAIRGLTLAEA